MDSSRARDAHGPALASLVFHADGQPIGDFQKAWRAACVAEGLGRYVDTEGQDNRGAGVKGAKYEGLLVHDFPRTASRNLRRAGVSESIAMSITGHKTASVFRRCDITDTRHQRLALGASQQLLTRAAGSNLLRVPDGENTENQGSGRRAGGR